MGNLTHYLPFILNEIEAQPKRQYLLLHSLKEVITSLSTSKQGLEQLLPSVPSIWGQLFKHCECSEEGSRNVVAECLGKLVLVNPEELLPQLQMALRSESHLMRTAVVTAIKFTISDQPQSIDPLLRQCIGQFLMALQDPEPAVRRVALVAFNSAVHNKPSLVRELLPELLPQLYSETKVKKDLIREVEMGPFKHTVDDGLDIRKAAFECMYTLLEQGLDRVDIMLFLEHVQAGLKDHYDIKMLTYLMTSRLAVLCPSAVLQSKFSIASMLEWLLPTFSFFRTGPVRRSPAGNLHAQGQSQLGQARVRKAGRTEAIRAASRRRPVADPESRYVLTHSSHTPSEMLNQPISPRADKNQHLAEFLSLIRSSSELQPLFESVQKDSSVLTNAANADSLSMDQS